MLKQNTKHFGNIMKSSSDTYEKLNNIFGNIDIVGEHGIVIKFMKVSTTMIGNIL